MLNPGTIMELGDINKPHCSAHVFRIWQIAETGVWTADWVRRFSKWIKSKNSVRMACKNVWFFLRSLSHRKGKNKILGKTYICIYIYTHLNRQTINGCEIECGFSWPIFSKKSKYAIKRNQYVISTTDLFSSLVWLRVSVSFLIFLFLGIFNRELQNRFSVIRGRWTYGIYKIRTILEYNISDQQ